MQYFSNQDPFYKSNENLTKIEKLVFTKGFFPVFLVFSRREIGDFSAGNSKPGKCATLIQTFRTILAKKGTNVFFPIFWLFFREFLSTLSVDANISDNFGEKRDE